MSDARWRLAVACCVMCLLWSPSPNAWAMDVFAGHQSEARREVGRPGPLHLSVSTDNDAFAGRGTDHGYTGGLALTVTGEPVAELFAPAFKALARLDRWVAPAHLRDGSTRASGAALRAGLVVFTPRDLELSWPVPADRPYANLAYAALSHFALDATETELYQSTLTVGLLGTSMAQELQSALHGAIGLRQPRGYGYQISNGGELTARYQVARHSLLHAGGGNRRSFDMKLMLEGSAGFLTEGAVGVGLRWGRINTPWWRTPSEHGEYMAQPGPRVIGGTAGKNDRTLYLSAGTKLRARLYNVFLQGQLRESAVTYETDALRPLVLEAWLGLSMEWGGLDVSYAVRYQTPELRGGLGASSLTWAGITIGGNLR